MSTSQSHASELATFAGGCFWCLQGPFEATPGVTNVMVGYSGGSKETASYYQVASGNTQHREAIHMCYDPARVSYEQLVELFFKQIDPTDPGGQFADRGHQYTSAVLYHTEEQKTIAEAYKQELEQSRKFDKPIVTAVEPFLSFYEAEEEHQRYYKKRPLQYKLYARGSGRTDFINQNWK